ncbi:MAG: hypothetical protein GY797_11745 [Deltaproteobacteria bacterium]|nr:hypothetical protein [Deltaproteobacteria bacterium]
MIWKKFISLNLSIKVMISIFLVLMNISICEGVGSKMTDKPVNLPKTVSGWTKSDNTQFINSKTIFKYMNGGGELYLAYRFDHLYVYHYEAKDKDKILVEVYHMKTANDAFGLLSLDWGGEPVILTSSPGNSPAKESAPSIVPPYRALYGGGLLRIWSGSLYSRVMAYRETPEAREAVISLGKAIAKDRSIAALPEILKVFPKTVGKDWKLRKDRIGYLRSHLVLNSLYFLSYKNILNLDLSTEAVTAQYENDIKPVIRTQALFIKYPSPIKAQQALEHFHDAYLSEQAKPSENSKTSIFNIKDGWLGYQLNGKCLTIVFGAPDRKAAKIIMEAVSCNTIK